MILQKTNKKSTQNVQLKKGSETKIIRLQSINNE